MRIQQNCDIETISKIAFRCISSKYNAKISDKQIAKTLNYENILNQFDIRVVA